MKLKFVGSNEDAGKFSQGFLPASRIFQKMIIKHGGII